TDSTAVSAFVGEHSAPAWGDLNGDGHPDLVVGNARGGLHFAWGMAYRPSVPPDTAGVPNEPSARAAAGVGPFASLSPNPAAETVTLRIDGAATYTLTDLRGRPWRAGRLSAGCHTLPLTGLPAGLYLLQLRDGAGRSFQVLKLLKK
ncbi:MAG: T9SS type A sorting domain-containing protein, partial [Bacteroidales bacterium]|nr:T9SS type A sorting domain-containing protein [Bacteroidales bacterium]